MKLVRYFVVGGASAAIDFALFGILLLFLGKANWFAAAAVGFVVATAFNYPRSIRMVFSPDVRFARRHEIMLVFVVSLIGLALNQSALWLLYQTGGWNVRFAKCVATGTAFLWNFAAQNGFVFRESR